ncbi:MAG: hypothetical protein P1U42_09535 [Phycisphaerales bacterium]|nr:hypothetical protein [Phycisphaerales bacterium]
MSLRATPSSRPAEPVSDEIGQRPWLGVRFVCSGTYQRVYRSTDGTKYMARCTKCGKSINFRVGQGGSNQRFFDVSCS